jgi:hypothetical protein
MLLRGHSGSKMVHCYYYLHDPGAQTQMSNKIKLIMGNMGETGQDQRESEDALRTLRQERAKLQAEIAALTAVSNKPVRVPTTAEVEVGIAQLAATLVKAASENSEDNFGKARAIIEKVTGGVIKVYQVGEPRKHHGWLRGAFKPQVVKMVADSLGIAVTGDAESPEVSIEFRKPPDHEQIAD